MNPHRLRVWLLTPALLAGGSFASAQSQPGPHVIGLGVYDQRGRFISGIRPEQLRVKGLRATIHSVEPDNSPRRILLLLDISGSMAEKCGGRTRWEAAIEIVKQFLAALPEYHSASLHVFATKHVMLVPYTHDFRSIRQQVEALPAPDTKVARKLYGARTYLGVALAEIVSTQEAGVNFGDTAVLVSDGQFEQDFFHTAPVSLEDLKATLALAGLRIILLRADRPCLNASPPSFLAGVEQGMTRLIEEMGGTTIDPWNRGVAGSGAYDYQFEPQRIGSSVHLAVDVIQNVYKVRLQLSEPLKRLRKFKLELPDAAGHTQHKFALLYSHYLAAPPPRPMTK